MTEISLKVLGAFELNADNQPINSHFRSDKVRALLIYLALQAERPHQRRSLAALLWPNHSERNGLRNLRKTLFHLRETLDQISPQANQLLLTIDRQTVRFNPANVIVDANQFERLLKDIEQHSHRHLHHCTDCVARLVTAETLFRGELLPDFSLADATAFEEWLLFRREQLQQRAILMLQNLVVIFEQQKEFGQAEKYASRLLLFDPYHEKAARQLMRILTQTNRRGAALQVYHRLNGRLQTEIGVPPENKTKQLFQQIAAGEFLKPAQTRRQLHHFPTQFTPFLGRKEDLVQANRFLSDASCRLLTIIGAGGIGKTRLALEAANQASEGDRFVDGIYFVALSELENGIDLPRFLATTLSIIPRANAPLFTQVLDFLKTKNCLLLLDNFEHLAGNESMVAELLAAIPGLTILITSRQPLYLRAEQQLRLVGLSYPQQPLRQRTGLPTQQTSTIEQAQTYDAVRFFVQSARQMRPDFVISSNNLAAILHICHLTQGSPLALEITAAWVRLMDVAAIAKTIAGSLDLLASPIQDIPDRHRSMRSVFDYSWQLLTLPEQLTLTKASIFREPFMLATAVAVLDTSIKHIASLLDKSLLQNPTPGRYSLHELLRQYMLEKLRQLENGDEIETAARRKHSEHYLTLVAEHARDFIGPKPQVAAAKIQERLGNVTQAWLWTVEHADEPEQQHLISLSVDGLGHFFAYTALADDGDRMMRAAVAQFKAMIDKNESDATHVQNTAEESKLLSHLLTWQARFQNKLGQVAAAVQTAQDALTVGTRDPETIARAKTHLGGLLPNIGQFDLAESHLQDAIACYRKTGDKIAQAQALGQLGITQWRRGDYHQAEPTLKEALALQKLSNHKGDIAVLSRSLAGLYYEQGDVKLAQTYVEQARNFFIEINNVIGVAQTDGNLALVYLKLGQYDLALTHNQRELNVYQKLGDRQATATSVGNRGTILMETGNFDTAVACFQNAGTLMQALDLGWHAARHQSLLAGALHRKGDKEQAMTLYSQAIPILREHGANYYIVSPMLDLARIYLDYGRYPAAQALIQEAMALADELHLKDQSLDARILVARLTFEQGNKKQAQQQLSNHLASSKDEEDRAKLHFALWQLCAGDKHAHTAQALYAKLYAQTPKHAFQQRLDELKDASAR